MLYSCIMKDKIYDGILYAYYGGLLNEHQHEVMRLYYDCDMSLSEISEISGITRQGVRDIIVRSLKKLSDYERKLGLVSKIKRIIVSIENFIENGNCSNEQHSALIKIVNDIKEI